MKPVMVLEFQMKINCHTHICNSQFLSLPLKQNRIMRGEFMPDCHTHSQIYIVKSSGVLLSSLYIACIH